MNKPISMSIIVVDLRDGFTPSAQVTYGFANGTEGYTSVKFDLDQMEANGIFMINLSPGRRDMANGEEDGRFGQ